MTSGFLQLESTLLIWKIFNPNYEFLVPLGLYFVQKYLKNAPIFFLDNDSPFNCLNDSVKILLSYS
jgi:hypothetical protein